MKRAIVVGAGFGGLALAIRLQSAGVETTIVEARDKPGGRAYFWQKDGFTFDAGPTVLTDPQALRELWGLTGRDIAEDVELLPVQPFYRLNWRDGTSFDYSNDDAQLHAEIARLSPDSEVDWSRVVVWWGDERFVEASSSDRNALQARSAFLDHVGVDPSKVHEMGSSDDFDDPAAAAASYGSELREHGSGDFDVVWGNVTRADPDILRGSFSSRLGNFYHLPASSLDTALSAQAATTDPAKRGQLVSQAQKLIVQNAYNVPVVELQTQLGVSDKVHGLEFDSGSRVQLHDTWIG